MIENKRDFVIIKLKEGESAYDVVADYINRYWDHNNMVDSVIVHIGVSYNGVGYYISREVAVPGNFADIEFINDWWEGEKYIKIFGIKSINSIDVYGGVYEK